MKYKQIRLKMPLRGNFMFEECELPYDRADNGEYIWAAETAFIYYDSDSLEWKKKLIEVQKQGAQEQIEKLSQFVERLDKFNKEL